MNDDEVNSKIKGWSLNIVEVDIRNDLCGVLFRHPDAQQRYAMYRVAKNLFSAKNPHSPQTIAMYMRDGSRFAWAIGPGDLCKVTRQQVETLWFACKQVPRVTGRGGHVRMVDLDADRLYIHTSGLRTVLETLHQIHGMPKKKAEDLVEELLDMPDNLKQDAARLRKERAERAAKRRQSVSDQDLAGLPERALDLEIHELERQMVAALAEGYADDDTQRQVHIFKRRRQNYALEDQAVIGVQRLEPGGDGRKDSAPVHFASPTPNITKLLNKLPWKHPAAPTIFRVTKEVEEKLKNPNLAPAEFPAFATGQEKKYFMKKLAQAMGRDLTQSRALRRRPNEIDNASQPDADLNRRNAHAPGSDMIVLYGGYPRPEPFKRAMYKAMALVPGARREYCERDRIKRVGDETTCRLCGKPFEVVAANPDVQRREFIAGQALMFDPVAEDHF